MVYFFVGWSTVSLDSCISISVNPYKDAIKDNDVIAMFNKFHKRYDPQGDEAGLPDKFVYECVQSYLWDKKMTVKAVSNGHVIVYD